MASMNTSASTPASQIVALLRELHPDDTLKYEPFWETLRDFFARGSDSLRERLSACVELQSLPQQPRRAKRRRIDEPPQELVQRCSQKRAARKRGIDCLCSSAKTSDIHKSIRLLLKPNNSPESATLSSGSRQKRVIETYDSIEGKSHAFEGLRRLNLLFIEYEVRRLQSSGDSGGRYHSSGEEAFSKEAEVTQKRVQEWRRYARRYLQFIEHENGLGFLLMLGVEKRRLWERDISNDDVSFIVQNCKSNHTEVMSMAKELQPLACCLVERGLSDYGADTKELRQGDHIFSRHFVQLTTNYARNDDTAAFDTPAAIAAHQNEERVLGDIDCDNLYAEQIRNDQLLATQGAAIDSDPRLMYGDNQAGNFHSCLLFNKDFWDDEQTTAFMRGVFNA